MSNNLVTFDMSSLHNKLTYILYDHQSCNTLVIVLFTFIIFQSCVIIQNIICKSNFEGKLKRSSYLTFSKRQLFKMNTLDWER